jgi:hypothetical protein
MGSVAAGLAQRRQAASTRAEGPPSSGCYGRWPLELGRLRDAEFWAGQPLPIPQRRAVEIFSTNLHVWQQFTRGLRGVTGAFATSSEGDAGVRQGNGEVRVGTGASAEVGPCAGAFNERTSERAQV